MKKGLKIILISIISIIVIFALCILFMSINNNKLMKVSEKARNLEFTKYNTTDEIKSYFGNPVWQDEFDGNSLNEDNWIYSGHKVHRNSEQQYYVDDSKSGNVYVANGELIIKGDKLEKSQYGYDYVSGSIETKGIKHFRYGYFEIKAKLPDGQGFWPAFWMMGQPSYLPSMQGNSWWPLCGEIDIMESIGAKENNNTLHGDLHWVNNLEEYFNWRKNGFHDSDTYRASNFIDTKPYVLDEGTFGSDYHVFGFAWSEKEMVWYIDGKSFMAIDVSGEEFEGFRKNGWYILLNLALGGSWCGDFDETTTFPAEFKIDYIRVYQ